MGTVGVGAVAASVGAIAANIGGLGLVFNALLNMVRVQYTPSLYPSPSISSFSPSSRVRYAISESS